MSENMDRLQLTLMLSSEPEPEPAAETRNTADVLGTSEVKKGKMKKMKNVSIEKPNRPRGLPSYRTAPTFAVQCKECKKWRVIPSQEEYEDIRERIMEDPFTCKRKENVSCNHPGDLEQGTGLWALDKPNLPKSPAGFKRKLSLRNHMNRLDCHYVTPNGKKLRAPPEVAAFLTQGVRKDVSMKDFDFRAPKIAKINTPLSD